ncbi:MAG: tRNA sulfurtransferase [Halanaeroarchaeum sp.]
MRLPGADAVLVRHGDIGVKSSSVQAAMERRLAEAIETMLDERGIEGRVEREPGRLIVRTDEPVAATEAATDVFGVLSASPVRTVEPTLAAIGDALAETARATYDGGSFAVDARRSGEQAFTSQEVGRVGGDAIWAAVEGEYDPTVDLDDPDHRYAVEVRKDEAYVYLEESDGPGGFPVGSQAPLVALVSGGIDSPVAAWQAMRRGSPIIPLYLDLGDYGGPDHRARAFAVIETLAEYAPGRDVRPRVVDAGEAVHRLVESVDNTRMLSYRRFMYRVAEHVAEVEGAAGIVTGEAFGQKSSQTVRNLNAVDRATRMPVHRPLATWDKHEIIAEARRIGTYRDATIDAGCNRIAPSNPSTGAPVDVVEEAEPDDLFAWAAETAETLSTVDLAPVPEGQG